MLSIEEVFLELNLFHMKTIILFLNYLLFCWSDNMYFNKENDNDGQCNLLGFFTFVLHKIKMLVLVRLEGHETHYII